MIGQGQPGIWGGFEGVTRDRRGRIRRIISASWFTLLASISSQCVLVILPYRVSFSLYFKYRHGRFDTRGGKGTHGNGMKYDR